MAWYALVISLRTPSHDIGHYCRKLQTKISAIACEQSLETPQWRDAVVHWDAGGTMGSQRRGENSTNGLAAAETVRETQDMLVTIARSQKGAKLV